MSDTESAEPTPPAWPVEPSTSTPPVTWTDGKASQEDYGNE